MTGLIGSGGELTPAQLAQRSGVAVSALHFYERQGLIRSRRTPGNQRRYAREMLRRVAFIRVSQRVGIPLAEIGAALNTLPEGRTPSREDWARLSALWRTDLDQRIEQLVRLRDDLSGCIGCGCLSLDRCVLFNPDDMLGKQGSRRSPSRSGVGMRPRFQIGPTTGLPGLITAAPASRDERPVPATIVADQFCGGSGRWRTLGVYDERRVKIVATLGPASRSPETLRELFDAGLDVVRINAAHGSPEDRARLVEDVRNVSQEAGRLVPILFDLRGLKIRTGPVLGDEKVGFARGGTVEIVNTPVPTTPERIGIDYAQLFDVIQPGSRVLISDGLIELLVEKIEDNVATCQVGRGGHIPGRQGVTLPGAMIKGGSLTEVDREDLQLGGRAGSRFHWPFVRHRRGRPSLCSRSRQLVQLPAAGADCQDRAS